jgi:hypothetical protein
MAQWRRRYQEVECVEGGLYRRVGPGRGISESQFLPLYVRIEA